MRLNLSAPGAFVPKRTFDCESQVAAAAMQINQLRAFNAESRDDDRTGPSFSLFVREIDDQTQVLPGNLGNAFPTSGGAFGRLAKRRSSQKNRGD
jgi:hypothetical protein